MPTVSVARAQLTGLKVATPGSMAGHSREDFPHRASQSGGCDTGETVLERDGSDPWLVEQGW
ncbi:hypothetical protein ACFC0S_00870 [Streptomyces sp. NPDC056084]|uniref:hypothetical protein n=1 Tax=unclassified Streptomyces TaxID=2593676 RepID=UPI0035E116D4